MRQALTFLATIGRDHGSMKTLALISLLALLTISGAAYTDQLFTGDQQTTRGELNSPLKHLGDDSMLSIDQFLRFISVPAVVAAFLIASQVSGAGIFQGSPMHLASE